MASVIQDRVKDPTTGVLRKNPYWTAVCTVYVNGMAKRVWRTTKVPIVAKAGRDEKSDGSLPTRHELKRKAEEVARGIESVLKAEQEGSATQATLEKIMSEVLERTEGRRFVSRSIESWLNEWVDSRKATISPRTLMKYKQIRDDFLESLGHKKTAKLDSIGQSDFVGFRDKLLKEGLAPQTVNQTVRKVLSTPFSLAWKQGLIPANPLAGMPPLKSVPFKKGVFDPEEVARMIEVASPDWKGAILTAYYTGARLKDVCNLRWENVDLENHVIRFIAQKTGTESIGMVGPELEEHLLSLPGSDDPKAFLFPSLAGKSGAGKSGLSMAFKRIMEAAKVPAGVAREKSGKGGRSLSLRSFHSFRHTFNSALANAGVSQEIRRKLTGHASDRMNAQYTHHEMEIFRSAVDRVPRIRKSEA
jgi:integrase